MKNIKITEENAEIYQELYEIKSGIYSNKNKALLNLAIIVSTMLVIIATCLLTISVTSLFPDFSMLQAIFIVLSSATGCTLLCNTILLVPKIIDNYQIKRIKKKHPNVDTDIEVKKLEKELQMYRGFLRIPKDIIKQKEECIPTLQSSNFKEMTNEDKITFLEQTKNILIQSKQYNNLTQEKNDTTEVVYQKKLGHIK